MVTKTPPQLDQATTVDPADLIVTWRSSGPMTAAPATAMQSYISTSLNLGTGPLQVVRLDGAGKLPAVDGSQLTNLPTGGTGTVNPTGTIAVNDVALFNNTAGTIIKSGGPLGALAFKTTASLTADVTGVLPVANGGTGANTLAATSLVIGNGTAALTTIASGTSGQALISNGPGVAPSFQATVSFRPPDVFIRDSKASGTPPQTAPAAAGWVVRDLTTLVRNQGTYATLATNNFTLVAGTYYLKASAPYGGGLHKIRLYNLTDSVPVEGGTNERNNSNSIVTRSFVSSTFTIASSKTFQIQHYIGGVGGGLFGSVLTLGDPEIYTEVEIWKTT